MKITTFLLTLVTITLLVVTSITKNPLYCLAAGLMGIATAISDNEVE